MKAAKTIEDRTWAVTLAILAIGLHFAVVMGARELAEFRVEIRDNWVNPTESADRAIGLLHSPGWLRYYLLSTVAIFAAALWLIQKYAGKSGSAC